MRESIDGFDAMAKQTGARIVHASGFDSIPSDLGVYLLVVGATVLMLVAIAHQSLRSQPRKTSTEGGH